MKTVLKFDDLDVARAVNAGLKAIQKENGVSLYQLTNEDILRRDHLMTLMRAGLKALSGDK